MKLQYFFQSLIIIAVLVSNAHGLKNLSISVPAAVLAGSTVRLQCLYDLENEPLYSVKWYKTNREFYRYTPKELPHVKLFPIARSHIDLQLSQSGPNDVVLKKVQYPASGKYTCEVSAETTFTTLIASSYMEVVYLPDTEPKISIRQQEYAVGDIIYANCTTGASVPAANVTWRINGGKFKKSFIRQNLVDDKEDMNKEVTIIGLRKVVSPNTFQNGKIRIECEATMFDLYRSKAEVTLKRNESDLSSSEQTSVSVSVGMPKYQINQSSWMLLFFFLIANYKTC